LPIADAVAETGRFGVKLRLVLVGDIQFSGHPEVYFCEYFVIAEGWLLSLERAFVAVEEASEGDTITFEKSMGRRGGQVGEERL
jgi:hypothetical protein